MQIAKLTKTEEIIMSIIWDLPIEPTSPEILEILINNYKINWTRQTVSVFLKQLIYKKYLIMEKNGLKCTYKTLISKSVYKRKLYRHLVYFWYHGNTMALCLDMIKNEDLKKEDLKYL